MPRVKDSGKEYTWHGQRSPKYMIKDTWLRHHPYWTEKEAEYVIESIQNYIMRKNA
jgi:hypothetical protein